jgi:hypothetical protein
MKKPKNVNANAPLVKKNKIAKIVVVILAIARIVNVKKIN